MGYERTRKMVLIQAVLAVPLAISSPLTTSTLEPTAPIPNSAPASSADTDDPDVAEPVPSFGELMSSVMADAERDEAEDRGTEAGLSTAAAEGPPSSAVHDPMLANLFHYPTHREHETQCRGRISRHGAGRQWE
ncbi:hypothetical protein BKA70DRAFT_1329194 [Coprinopsis sp. MPI-PUGE-AT-0042]|nr:hypothetical protein BKA70DRAFT_1329194 [Coprinopsis sp. MPI-PUGE-AT-0042]